MLNEYKKTHKKASLQYILVDNNGIVLESDDVFFKKIEKKTIFSLHPFFESFSSLLEITNQDYLFTCIHLEVNKQQIITDISLKTFGKSKPALITIHDLTTHYNNYQLTAQKRNESVIGSQILELKNNYLKEKEEFKNNFIANFSHEIREPLTGINTFIGLLNKTPLNVEQKGYLNIINKASLHLDHMIEDILDLSKIEIGILNLIEEEFNFHQFINDVVSKYQVKASEKNIALQLKIQENTPKQLIGDSFRLQQILNNLLDNAIKFTNSGSVNLEVSLNQIRANKANIHFIITDTGVGIAEKDLQIIFNRFTQLNTQQHTKGSGLGLTITKSLVELMNGNINVKSTENKGTSVSFNLSFKLKPAIKKPKLSKQETKEEVISSTQKKHILLVENSEITQLAVLKILAGQKKYYLDIISNTEAVIPTLQNQKVDLILMDINLPNITGDELTKKIRQLPEKNLKKTPVIALTGKVFPEDLKRYKKAKMNAVIAKPFNESSLLETINKFLNKKS
ncbi:MAG: hybrid sensor histidine kinase/response regulator [Oceanihabitans sp.]